MKKLDNQEWIDAYHNGSLSKNEQEDFLAKMEQDEDFRQEVQLQKDIRDVFKDLEYLDFVASLKEKYRPVAQAMEIEVKGKEETKKAIIPPKEAKVKNIWTSSTRIISIAASIAALIAIALWITQTPEQPENNLVIEEKPISDDFFPIALIDTVSGKFGYTKVDIKQPGFIQVLIKKSEAHSFHYRFVKDLELFVPYDQEIVQNSQLERLGKTTYLLHLNEETYKIDKGKFEIFPLNKYQ